MKAYGYAVAQDGKIDVRTVSPTASAAMVNWLCASRGVMLSDAVDDAAVKRMFDSVRDVYDARLISVSIVESL